MPSEPQRARGVRIVRAETMGLCFGVRDALAQTLAEPAPEEVTIHGELVHNEAVLADLRARGFTLLPESRRDGPLGTPAVLITAHGVSDRERARLARAAARVVDTTCPLVRKAHDAARRLAAAGRHVVVIGKPGHVEVRGLVGDLPSHDTAPDVASVARYPYPRLGVVCQTTTDEATAREVLAEIERMNPHADIEFADTICEPTRQRVRSARQLAATTDVVVVVGGRNSNNTAQLARLCAAAGARVHHVQGPADLDRAWFAGCESIGLTAGTSTLDATVDAVESELRRIVSG